MKKLLNKKNNKGFSLVELIVVVLIMGIIAVALAPQVMKWVDKSRENTDANQMATIKAAAQTAVAEYMENNSISAGDYKIETNQVSGGTSALADLFEAVLGDAPYPTPKDSGSNFYIHVSSTGTVKVDTSAGAGATP